MPLFPPSSPYSLGYGGEEYGYSPYGSGIYVRPPVSPNGGYGGAGYGINSYGSIDITPPRISSAVSLDGFRIEVFFSEEMAVGSGSTYLFDPANYSLTANLGAPTAVVSVLPGTPGILGGYTSVILVHEGTTLGGNYTVTAINIVDVAGGNPIDSMPTNSFSLLTLGEGAEFTVTPLSGGDALRISFWQPGSGATVSQDMLTEAEFSPGIKDPASYDFEASYPVPLAIQSITHPLLSDASKVLMGVQGQTAASYTLTISPATSIEYDGTVLPSADPGFNGVEIGTGSSMVTPSGLSLTKSVSSYYGWQFEDTSGRMLPGSSFRLDFTFQVPTAPFSILPPLTNRALGTLFVSDGAVQLSVTLDRVSTVDVLKVQSGAYSLTLPVSWSSGSPVTLSILRNEKADSYAFLVNGTPVIAQAAASFTGTPTIAPGAAFLLGLYYEVNGFIISQLDLTATQTVFTDSWNFLHNGTSVFIGSSALTRNHILTERGPLVKGWGDATPAEVSDVEVLVNGVAVDVASVNPYQGLIYPTIPIPLMPVGSTTVEVNYTWFPNPAFEMTGLNTLGLTLNKWNLTNGHHEPGVNPSPDTSLGVADITRFPMGIALPPLTRQHPILIGHRYIGFEKEYTAALNSPTTLLLNQNPHRVSTEYLSRTPDGVSVAYEGEVAPPLADPEWDLEGIDDGFTNSDGTYTLIDASAGSFSEGTAAVYSRREDLSFPLSVVIPGRFVVREYEPDGVFTGIGFGVHDNRRLYLAGCLDINDVKHVGFLQDATRPDLQESWEIGPKSDITIQDSTSFTVATSDLPNIVEVGVRFQIFEGSQAGVYTIAGIEPDGLTTTVTIRSSDPFPADPRYWGNSHASAYFEVLWDSQLTTYRMVVDNDGEIAQFYVGGSLAGLVLTVTEVRASPVDTALLLTTGQEGQVFWGSLSRIATNRSVWSFFRYGITPDATTFSSRGIVVDAEMSVLPEDDPNNEWFLTNHFGYSEIDGTFDTLLLKSTSEWPYDTLDLTFGYGRIEPALDTKTLVDIDLEFKVESGTRGTGDALVKVFDTVRQIRFATLLYYENSGHFLYGTLPVGSLSGLFTPEAQGWESSTVNDLTASVQGQVLTIRQALGDTGLWKTLVPDPDFFGNQIIEARVAIDSYTPGSGARVGPIFGSNAMDAFMDRRVVAISFRHAGTPEVMLTSSGVPVLAVSFDWTDGEYHTYRVETNITGPISFYIDDVLVGTSDIFSFDLTTTDPYIFVGATGTDAASVARVDSFSVQLRPPDSAKRTLGIYLGGDASRIDSWAVPRSDSTDLPNSSPGAVIVEMDWREFIKVRLQIDPAWGVVVLRPDLPLPPWYDGDFATETTIPSAGWINVDYRRLPRQAAVLGAIQWGALDPRSVTQQRWRRFRYRVYTQPLEDYLSPQNMVLNWYNVITSGEYNRDITVEVVEVESITPYLVSLRPAHMNADRVFVVQVDGEVVPSANWAFDAATQTIVLSSPLPSEHYPVTVSFAPGKPITNTYLCSQPLLDSVTLLNDTTPPVPKSQVIDTIREVVFGSAINDPEDTLYDDMDFVLNDPFRVVQFSDDPDALYENIEFCTVDDGGQEGLLSSICDGPAPGMGLVGLTLEGGLFWDVFTVPGGPGGTFGYATGGSPSIGGSASTFDQTSVLHASGGSYSDGVLGGGAVRGAVLFPNYPSGPDIVPFTGAGGSQEIRWRLDYTDPFTDIYDLPSILTDNVPPSLPDLEENEPNPDGTPGVHGHGAVVVLVEDGGTTGYSRLGPWGGTPSLEPESFLAGGATVLPGNPFTLAGGAPLAANTLTTLHLEAAN